MTRAVLNLVPTVLFLGVVLGISHAAVGQDCNSNDVGDDLDVAYGTSEDCNNNRIPD
jgi:hypothetical protein